MILQNGMGVSDVSTVSNDHAVATEAATARQIEILRGPAALLYGSGAIGGLVNVVNDRIPTELVGKPTGTVEGRYGTVDGEKNTSFSLDTSAGQIGLHLDGNYRDTDNTKIPGNVRQGDGSSASGRLPNSFTHETSLGGGISYVTNWGYIGLSAATLDDHYGIPTDEKSFIDLHQNRYDLDTVVNNPFAGIEKFRFRMGYTDYSHIEKAEDGTPNTVFANRAVQTRWERLARHLRRADRAEQLLGPHARYRGLRADPAHAVEVLCRLPGGRTPVRPGAGQRRPARREREPASGQRQRPAGTRFQPGVLVHRRPVDLPARLRPGPDLFLCPACADGGGALFQRSP
jgi:hypothetical protein